MPQQVRRWTEVTPSQFTHEAEGLAIIRDMFPDQAPFRAWSNFEFRDGHGKWHEVDLLVLGRRRLHLIELKYYAGTLRGDDHTWRRDGHRAQDSPLKLARRKAQRLASKLQDELLTAAHETHAELQDPRTVVPFVQESVFLHHRSFRCALPESSRLDLFGLDGREQQSGLPGISERVLEPATPNQAIGPNQSDIIARLMERIGVVRRRQREAGSWVIDEDPLGEGDGWQDWPAFHRVATTERARIRFLVCPPGASATARARLRQVAEHEYRLMSRLPNDRLLRPKDMVENDLGTGLVYPLDERYQRLDLYLADHAGQVTARDQAGLLRQVAEAVSYAHRNRIVHRGLTPHAVLVRSLPDGDGVRVLVGDWQSAGAATADGRATLRDRLNREHGLDLAVDLPQVTPKLRALVLDATRPAVTERLPDVRAFLDRLDEAGADADPGEDVADPLDAAPGAVIDDRFRLQRRLGTGSTAMGLLVRHLADTDSGPEAARVLKVALPGPAGTVGHRPAGGPGRPGPGRHRPPGHQAREPGREGDAGEGRTRSAPTTIRSRGAGRGARWTWSSATSATPAG